jgi:soluble lytic murein transglycosylase-like protein
MVERQREEARNMLQRSHSANAPYRGGSVRSIPMTEDVQKLVQHYTALLSERVRGIFAPYMSFIQQHNPRLGPAKAALIAANLLHFADRYEVDPRLVVSMIIAESDFDPNSTSRTGAAGLGQLMPGTARMLGINNAYDPVQNLDGSIRYLRNRLDLFRDKGMPGGGMSFEQIRLAMAAYNAGAGAVKKHGGVPPYRETQAYVRRIETLYRQLTGQ